MTRVNVTVDGTAYADDVEPRLLLVHYLRERLGKVGTVVGCDTSNCGSCTVLLDGLSVKSCSVLAVQADGASVLTVEGLTGPDGIARASCIQKPFQALELAARLAALVPEEAPKGALSHEVQTESV